MVHPLLTKAPAVRPDAPQPLDYKIRRMFWAYLACVAFNLAVSVLATPLGLLFTYIPTGIYLCRLINRRVERHPLLANLDNVADANLKAVLTWPRAVPRFLWKLSLAKHL